MKKIWYYLVIASLFLLGSFIVSGCFGQNQKQVTAPPVEITISAAASLQDALNEISVSYQQEHPNVIIRYNFGASGSLQQQIEQGAQVDAFISAADKNMDVLENKNLIDKASRQILLYNELVLVVPMQGHESIAAFQDIASPAVSRVAIGIPATVPAGQYAEETLKQLDLWDKVVPKMVQAKDVRQVLTYVELGNVDAGLVYKTDAAVSNKVKMVSAAPAGSHKPITYPMAIVSGTKNPDAAKDYLSYLRGAKAADIFKKYGFVLPER